MTLTTQVSELTREAKAMPSKGIEYMGVWSKGISYSIGDFVTHRGSLWHSHGSDVTARPVAGSDWTLAVKKGKDAR